MPLSSLGVAGSGISGGFGSLCPLLVFISLYIGVDHPVVGVFVLPYNAYAAPAFTLLLYQRLAGAGFQHS